MSENLSSDAVSRFTFDECAVRGEHVTLESSYQELLAIHQYPPVVARLLGEISAAACLLAETIKFDGTLTLQIRSEGEVPLIMAEVTSQQSYRAIARQAQNASSNDFATLFTNGQLCLTVQPRSGKPYQGIVTLTGSSLAASLESYFTQSEQLQTRIWLCADGDRAAGFLLQQMPGADGAEHWSHLSQLTATLTDAELLQLPRDELLHRLYHQEIVRVHPEKPVQFHCTCSRARLEQVLVSLGADELEDILEEKSVIDVNCEFCNRFYSFDRAEIHALLSQPPAPGRH